MIATAVETIFGLLLVLGWKTRIAALAKRTSSDHVCTDDDLGFGCAGASPSLGFFGRRGSTAPGGAWKVPVEPRRIASTESARENDLSVADQETIAFLTPVIIIET
jgi:hypothetical protein